LPSQGGEEVLLRVPWAVDLVLCEHLAIAIDESREDLRPTDVEPMTRAATARATIATRMAEGDKPYRLYRGGRKKGKVLSERRRAPRRSPRARPVRRGGDAGASGSA
jgi:hypothetical protein